MGFLAEDFMKWETVEFIQALPAVAYDKKNKLVVVSLYGITKETHFSLAFSLTDVDKMVKEIKKVLDYIDEKDVQK